MENEDVDFEYYVRSGSLVHIVRYDRDCNVQDKIVGNLSDKMTFHVDDFMLSFKDTITGSIYMRFERYDDVYVTSFTTLYCNVYTDYEDGEENECLFYDDDVDEIIPYQFHDAEFAKLRPISAPAQSHHR